MPWLMRKAASGWVLFALSLENKPTRFSLVLVLVCSSHANDESLAPSIESERDRVGI